MPVTDVSPWLRRLAALGVLSALLFGTQIARAGDGDEDGEGQEDGDEGPEEDGDFARLEREVQDCFAQKKYADAAEKCRAQMALVPKHPTPPYNLACALARLGKKEDALAALAKSVELGFDEADHMKVDEDLASLHEEKGFADVVAKCAEAQKAAWEKLYDPLPDVPELKAVDASPAGGLRYRLLMSKDASAEKPQRLLVWLHPSGGSMNKVVAGCAARWSKAGWALLVPTQKRWGGWTNDDAAQLVQHTLPEAAKTPGVDAKRPVLIGFSAGGQMAIELWRKDAGRWGGLVLDAAYPIDVEAARSGSMVVIAPPEGDAPKSAPVSVLVGDADQGHFLWKQAEGSWRRAGVPLTVTYVAGGKHAWLVKGADADALDAWLADVAAGKLPGKEEAKPKEPVEAPK
jgi:predicted esterase